MDQQLLVFFTARTSEELKQGVRVDLPLRKGKDFQGTVYDLRMGAFESGQVCETCGERDLRCPGHFGYIDLPEPCFNPCYGEVVAEILNSVCFECYSPRLELFPDEKLSFTDYASRAKNVGSCHSCESPFAKFTFKKARDKNKDQTRTGETYLKSRSKFKESRSIPPSIMMTYPKESKSAMELSAKDVLIFFGKLTEETLTKIGFNQNVDFLQSVVSTSPKLNTHGKASVYHFRPESLLTESLPVLPPTARPRVMVGLEKRSDDLTEAYNKIVKYTNQARKMLESWSSDAESKYKNLCERIQIEYWKMTAPAPKNGKASSVRAVKSLGDRLGGKEGRKTSNVAGKRSDMTSRTVGSPGGSSIPFGSLGYPEIFAKKLTQKEPVTKWNLEWANYLLDQGKINIVERPGLGKIVVSRVCKDQKPFEYDGVRGLMVGDLIHRQIMDGDPFFVGRQPSLRPESIQGVKAKLVKEITHMLPLANTRPLNADYDGDEFNVSVPQEIGLIEAMTMGSAVYHAVSAQNGAPVMGCVQNTLTMAGICTNTFDTPRNAGDRSTTKLPDGQKGYEILISRESAYDAYTQAKIPNKEIIAYTARVGKVYPQYVEKTKTGGLRFAKMITGKVLYSIVFPKNLRWKRETKTNPYYPTVIIHDGILTPQSGPLCKSCIGGTAGSIIHLMWREHPKLNKKFINRLVMISSVLNFRVGFSFSFGDCQAEETISRNIKVAIEEANMTVRSVLEKNLDPEEREKEINKAYNKVREISPTIRNNLKKGMHNSLRILTSFGIKGNDLNVSQTAGITGQQNLGGGRIPWGMTNQTRLTAHFPRNDQKPEARGFIKHSYLEGLDFEESFAAAMAGREAVVATGTRTADSGYTQKKMSKFLGDIKAYPDGTLRNAQGQIVSSLYGGDGLNVKMKIHSHTPEMGVIKAPKILFFSKLDHLIQQLESDYETEHGPGHHKKKISAEEAEAIVSKIQAGAPGYQSPVTRMSTENQKKKLIEMLATAVTYTDILPELAAKITEDFERAKVYYGYPAGLMACLSIGEITTQLTLNTFHGAGIGEKDVSVGIPRLNEIVNVSWEPKRPTMTIYISSRPKPNETKVDGLKRCSEIANKLKYQTVGNLLKGSPTLLRVGAYAPEKESPLSYEGLYQRFKTPTWMKFFCSAYASSPLKKEVEWVIRLDLDRQKVYDAVLSPWEIAEAIENFHQTEGDSPSIRCIPSPCSEGQILVFLNSDDAGNYARTLMTYPEGMVYEDLLYTDENIPFFAAKEISNSLTSIPVQGISKISKVTCRLEQEEWVVDTQGSNLLEVLADPTVDPTRTISDNIREIELVLGIEASRAFLESELKKIIRFDGASVDDCHFSVVADAMSFLGALTPISRYGISRDVGPLSKLMFERPVTEAVNSVVGGEIDKVRTIDAAVYMGQVPRLGTGCVKVISGEISKSSMPVRPGPRNGQVPRVTKAR